MKRACRPCGQSSSFWHHEVTDEFTRSYFVFASGDVVLECESTVRVSRSSHNTIVRSSSSTGGQVVQVGRKRTIGSDHMNLHQAQTIHARKLFLGAKTWSGACASSVAPEYLNLGLSA